MDDDIAIKLIDGLARVETKVGSLDKKVSGMSKDIDSLKSSRNRMIGGAVVLSMIGGFVIHMFKSIPWGKIG